jgi:DNA polymerase III subunit delta'
MLGFLPWQVSQWQRLQAARHQNRLAHALLLYGPEQTGKRRFAEALAQGLLCASPLADGLACGHCRSCLLLLAGNHADLGFLEPEEESKVIKIDAVRQFTGSEALSSQSGGYRVLLIHPADAMNQSAANALLKTLEEPSPSTLMLLVSSRPAALPATIRSRCQAIGFPLPAAEQALPWLESQEKADWRTLLAAAAGAPLKALAWSAEGMSQARRQQQEEVLALLEGRVDPVRLAEGWQKRDADLLLQWFATLILDISRLAIQPDYLGLFNPDARDRLTQLAGRRRAASWHKILQNVLTVRMMLNRPLNLQLQLEALLISIIDLDAPRQSRGIY